MADVAYLSPCEYNLPESLASACGLGHDLHYLREFGPNDEFPASGALRHNFDLSVGDYSSGKYNYTGDCLLLDTCEVHAPFKDPPTVHSDTAGDGDWGSAFP